MIGMLHSMSLFLALARPVGGTPKCLQLKVQRTKSQNGTVPMSAAPSMLCVSLSGDEWCK
jgi:hypothetical protein